MRGGRCRSNAAREKCPACNGLQCAVAWLVRKRADDALRRVVPTPDALMMLRINMEAGHAGAAGRFDRLDEVAMVYAFLLSVLGKA